MKSITHSIARVCHDMNSDYCRKIGDVVPPAWDDMPPEMQQGTIKGVELFLANPNLSPSAMHDAWKQEKLEQGWTYAPVKSIKDKTHPNIKPFADLSAEQQFKDWLFSATVRNIAREMAR